MDIESLEISFVLNSNFTGYLSKVLLFLITFPSSKTKFFLILPVCLYKCPANICLNGDVLKVS